jgi:hypothetical protein
MPNNRRASRGRIPASEESHVLKADRERGLQARKLGDLGEVAFLHKATALGFVVAQPYAWAIPLTSSCREVGISAACR